MNLRLQGLVIGLFGLMSWTAFSATTGSFQLSGVINQVLAIVVTPEAIATSLDLTATQADLKVATISEASNSNTGYKITVSSLNNGKLLRSGCAEFVSYTAKYSGASVNLTTSHTTPVIGKTVSTSGVYATSSDFKVSYAGVPAASMVAGTYSDTVSFEIAAN